MKKLLFPLACLFLIITFSQQSYASMPGGKKGFKGVITFSISYEGESLTPAQTAYMPKTSIVKIMDNKSINIMNYGMGAQSTIEDPENDRYVILIEGGGKKKYYKTKLSEERQRKDSTLKASTDITLDLINETKVIAGFECKKAVITVTPKDTADGEAQTIIVYYSPEMGSKELNDGDIFAGIDGMLLEYVIDAGDIQVKYTATEVKKGGVSSTDFLIPDDFVEFTTEEIEKMKGGGATETEEEEED